ncbi:hypothetical protein GH5_08560 [Leishmania sp. Ghana 2012 LV757]|uniref:uncharacterized protein n=1 Tax=Leishmania sp. Ghana 2012 LV757 TaxID=2803181 RepID=UPI001B72DE76|nr:hypothetical protein GH5_08560 [Leishmania sp. Ghana 2012 LV757]
MQRPREDNRGHHRRGHDTRHDDDEERRKQSGSKSMGAAIALAFGAGALVFAGASALYSWCTQENSQRDHSFYCLPPRDGITGATAASTQLSPVTSAGADGKKKIEAKEAISHSPVAVSDGCSAPLFSEAGGGHPCVCCLERQQSFMFVQCRHICLCEPCLIQLGRSYEDHTLRARFDGPVKLPCPVCRCVGYVVKTFSS